MRLPLLLLLGLVACGPPAWQDAQRDGSAHAYEQFATDYATYPQANAALNRAEVLRWNKATEANTAAAWSAYLYRHGDSNRADEARRNMDDRAYNEALEDKDALALERYLSLFTEGTHRKEARGHLDAVRWHDAKSEDTHVGYRRYLLQEPKGEHRDEANKRYQERVWERAVRLDTLRALRGYLAEFHDGGHVDEAKSRIAELSFSRVRLVVALAESWDPDRRTALSVLKAEAGKLLPPNLKAVGFEVVGSVEAVDLGPDPGVDVAGAVPMEPGMGTVVVVISASQGEAYLPRGHATNMTGSVRVYVPTRAEELGSWPVSGKTTASVRSATLAGLFKDAAHEVMVDAAGQVGRVRPWHPNPP